MCNPRSLYPALLNLSRPDSSSPSSLRNSIFSSFINPEISASISAQIGTTSEPSSVAISYISFKNWLLSNLVGNCEYTLSGIVPKARYWSYAIYGNDNYYLQDPNNLKENPTYEDLFAQVTNGYEITTNIGEKYQIKIGNNFVSQDGTLSHFGNDFNLILRIYGPDLIYYDNPSLIPVANIEKGNCKWKIHL